MRKEIRRPLIAAFSKALADLDHEFVLCKPSSRYAGSNDVVFSKSAPNTSLRFFVILIIDEQREAFTVEIGWSTLGRFPELPARPAGSPTTERIEFTRPEFVFRLSDLFEQGHSWHLQPDFDPLVDDFLAYVKSSLEPITPEQAVALAEVHTKDAADKIGRFGLPYLSEFAQHATTSADKKENER